MIVAYDDFQDVLNRHVFEHSYSDLIEKIANYPDRYIGLFRPTKPKTKLIQNITQSHEIRFGDALEAVFGIYFRNLKFHILEKVVKTTDDKVLNIDQLFSKDDVIYLIEQKVRDDHDSTKKVGQFKNFEDKYFAVSSKYNKKVVPMMWFIDDTLRKNHRYYTAQMKKMSEDYKCETYLFYGAELFGQQIGNTAFPLNMWNEIISYMEKWKNRLPEMPEVNFDLTADKVFDEIKDISPSTYRKLFENKDIILQIFPIIFPQKKVLDKLITYFSDQAKPIYETLTEKLKNAMQLY